MGVREGMKIRFWGRRDVRGEAYAVAFISEGSMKQRVGVGG